MVLDWFFARFWGVCGGLEGPLEATFGRLWQSLGTLWAPVGSLWGTLGVLGITLGALRVTLGSVGAPPGDISAYGDHFERDLESPCGELFKYVVIIPQVLLRCSWDSPEVLL